jgi:hypothetical protein
MQATSNGSVSRNFRQTDGVGVSDIIRAAKRVSYRTRPYTTRISFSFANSLRGGAVFEGATPGSKKARVVQSRTVKLLRRPRMCEAVGWP